MTRAQAERLGLWRAQLAARPLGGEVRSSVDADAIVAKDRQPELVQLGGVGQRVVSVGFGG